DHHSQQQADSNGADNPWHRFALDRAPNFPRNISFLANTAQPEREIFARSSDLFFQLRVRFVSRSFSHSRSFFNSALVARKIGRLIPMVAIRKKTNAIKRWSPAAPNAVHNHEIFAKCATATTAVASRNTYPNAKKSSAAI